MSPEQIIAANAARAAALRAAWDAYDPIRGTEGCVPRVPLRWDSEKPLLIPAAMLDDEAEGPTLRYCVEEGVPVSSLFDGAIPEEVWVRFCRVRIRYDYEYWCATCVTIEDKETKSLVNLTLTPPQRASFAHREALRAEGRPVRQIELKHRQYGSTTEKGAYVAWLQNVVTDGRHAWMISLQQGGAGEIARRYELLQEHYPSWAGAVTSEGVRNSPNARRIVENGAIYGMASANNPQGPSGYTAHIVLISEAGKMGSTDVLSAERLITNVTSMIPRKPGTCAMVESTAEPVGRWFREEWAQAERGASAFAAHFTNWTSDPSCWADLTEAECVHRAGGVAEWVASLSEYHLALFTEHGACLEQVAWYVDAKAEKPNAWSMKQENPTTAAEAWQYGERRRFDPPLVIAARKTCEEPAKRGRLRADALTGEGALHNIRWEDDPRGEISIWHLPSEDYGLLDLKTCRYTHAFAAAMDVGGTWEKADYTVVTVLDRRPTTFGAPPEIVAEWHGHLDQDLAAWEAARLAMWYGKALLAVEVNSLREDLGDPDDGLEPEHSLTVLDQIGLVYPRLYRRHAGQDRVTGAARHVYGWHTNKRTKPLAVDLLNRALREGCAATATGEGGGYVERSLAACDELDSYLVLDTGAMAAAPGRKDDRVITRAILMALHEEMPRCEAVDLADEEAARRAVARTAQAMASV